MVDVRRGLFEVELDFGADAFNGDERWLEIAVRHPAGTGEYVPMVVRQKITTAPYAVHAVGQSSLSAADGDPAQVPGGR